MDKRQTEDTEVILMDPNLILIILLWLLKLKISSQSANIKSYMKVVHEVVNII